MKACAAGCNRMPTRKLNTCLHYAPQPTCYRPFNFEVNDASSESRFKIMQGKSWTRPALKYAAKHLSCADSNYSCV